MQQHIAETPVAAPAAPLTRLRPYLFPALLIVITVVAYAQVFSCGFIEAYDDEAFVTKNAFVLQGLSWQGLKWSFMSFQTGNWHPLTWWSHMADVTLFGRNPAGHHAASLTLHLLNTLLLYRFFLKTTTFPGRCFVIAALFALHPLHVESVAWIAERKDLLSTAFGLGALHSYLQFVRSRGMAPYLTMFALLCLSLMAKPMLVTFPFLLLVLDYWPLARVREQSFLSLVREKLPLFLPVLAISIVTIVAQGSVGAIVRRSLSARLASALDAYLVYLQKFLIPLDLASFYPSVPIALPRTVTAALLLAVVSLGVWHYRHRSPWLVTGWLWYLGLLVPVIGFIGVGEQAYADRYMYLPLVGIGLMTVWPCARLFPHIPSLARVKTMAAATVIAACALASWKQVGYWRDGFTLYGRELAVVPGNWHAHINLGNMLVERKRFTEGIAHYQEAILNYPPAEANIRHNIGVAYERMGDNALAENYFRSTAQLAPDRDKGYLGLARILGNSGDLTGALKVIREGLRNVPDNWLLLAKEAYLLHKMGDITGAINSYRQAIARKPEFVQNYVNLGVLLAQQGNTAEFGAIVDQLRRIDPVAAAGLVKSRENN